MDGITVDVLICLTKSTQKTESEILFGKDYTILLSFPGTLKNGVPMGEGSYQVEIQEAGAIVVIYKVLPSAYGHPLYFWGSQKKTYVSEGDHVTLSF